MLTQEVCLEELCHHVFALSFIAPSSVTPSATEYDGAFKLLAVTWTDSPFMVSDPVIDSAALCHIFCNRARWGAQAAASHWDRQPSHGEDFLKRSLTKITARRRCYPCWLSLGSTVHSRKWLPEAHLHQSHSSASSPPLKPSQTSVHEG